MLFFKSRSLSSSAGVFPASLEHRLEYDFKGVEFFFRRLGYWLKIDKRRFFIIVYVTINLLLSLTEAIKNFLERRLEKVLTRIRGTHDPRSVGGTVSSHLQELSGYKKEE